MRTRHLTIVAVLALLLTGCAAPTPEPGGAPDESDRGTLEPIPNPDGIGEVEAEWIDRGRSIEVTTWGSSNCPPIPVETEATAAGTVTVHFESSTQDPCTADMAPTTHVVALPAGLSVPLTVVLSWESGDATTFVLE